VSTERLVSAVEDVSRQVATLTERMDHVLADNHDQEKRLRSLEIGRWRMAGVLAAGQLVVIPIVVALAIKQFGG
jgi:hypothetical protein